MYKKYALVLAIAIFLPVISFAQAAPKGPAYVKRADGTYVAYPTGLPNWRSGNEGLYKWDSETLTEKERTKNNLVKNVPISYPVAVKDLQKFEVLIPDLPTDGKYALQGSYMEPVGNSYIVRSFDGVLQPGTKVTVTDPKTGKPVTMLMEDAYKQGLIKLTGYYNPVSGNVVDVGYDIVVNPKPKSPVKPSPKPTFSNPAPNYTPVSPKDKPAATVKPNEPAVLPTTTVVRISPNSNPRVVNIEVITCVGGDCTSKPKIVRLTPEEADSIGEGSATARGIIQALFPNASVVVPRPRNPFSGDVPDAPEPVLNFSDSRAR